MTLALISFLVFIATAGLALAGFYFLVEEPAERRRIRDRLEAIGQSSDREETNEESLLMRNLVLSQIPRLNALLLKAPLLRNLHIFLRQSDTTLSVERFMLITAGVWVLTIVAGLILRLPLYLGLLFACFTAVLPLAVLAIKRHRRLSKFDEQFPDSIELLARAVRAGHAFTTGLDLIAKEMSNPLAAEFKTVYDQQNLGLSMRDALANLAVRIPLSDVRIFVTALQVQRETGGNLAEILDNLSTVIRERFKLMRQVRVITAEGRLSLYVLTALPFVAGILFFMMNPEYMMPLLEDPLGHQMIAGALVLQLIGYAIISRIVRIKV